MAHIIINPSLSAAIGYKKKCNPPKFAVVIAILEPANSTRTDNSQQIFMLCIEVCRHVGMCKCKLATEALRLESNIVFVCCICKYSSNFRTCVLQVK